MTLLLLPNTISASALTSDQSVVDEARNVSFDTGCTLEIPHAVGRQKEARGNPLMIYIGMKVLRVRDIPDQGGSFGIDIK